VVAAAQVGTEAMAVLVYMVAVVAELLDILLYKPADVAAKVLLFANLLAERPSMLY
jgi:hypothetical protein